jgi:hypothetical protein
MTTLEGAVRLGDVSQGKRSTIASLPVGDDALGRTVAAPEKIAGVGLWSIWDTSQCLDEMRVERNIALFRTNPPSWLPVIHFGTAAATPVFVLGFGTLGSVTGENREHWDLRQPSPGRAELTRLHKYVYEAIG